MDERELEEILEFVWVEAEVGNVTTQDLVKSKEPNINADILNNLVDRGYLIISDNKVSLTEKGNAIALRIVRCHRLAERLFWDVLELSSYKEIEDNACTFEHLLSPEMADAICTLLGHPKECPHGGSIPRGSCCRKAQSEVASIIVPISKLKVSENGKVAYIATKHHSRLDKLTSLGLSPGVGIKVHQTFPTFVVQAEHTHIALDREILEDIYVRRGK